jgi:uncharacterized protein (DUF488 family)
MSRRHRNQMKQRTLSVMTIGYEGAAVDDFLRTLKRAHVTLLLDVRELPLSRRKGYSKTALTSALARAGIGYRHERALGSPKAVRHQLRADGDYKRYFRDFREYLSSQRKLLDTLAHELSGGVVLLCYERNPAECHRSVVAHELATRAKTSVNHLEVIRHGSTRSPTRADSRQGVSAAE